jgi:hypothetical protein
MRGGHLDSALPQPRVAQAARQRTRAGPPAKQKAVVAGHGVWVHDVFAFRGLPAAWKEILVWSNAAEVRVADEEDRKKLHRIGDEPIIVTLSLVGEDTIELAARAEHEGDLLGPFASAHGRALLTMPTPAAESAL